MRYEDREIRSVGELIQNLNEHIGDHEGPIWYRGQSSAEWRLEPKLLRTVPVPSESHLLNRFKQNAILLLSRQPQSEFDWLFLMQHYSVPTRLLDWSESPLAALYFALVSNPGEVGALWVLLPTVLNQKSNYRPDFEHEVPSFEDEQLQNYLPATIAREHSSKLYPIAAIAPRNSSRMQAQQGVFTISHRENIYIEDVGAEGAARDHIWRYVIPHDSKVSLQKELRLLGYTKFQLFPELESLGGTL
jgi:hypothetical protein